MAMGLGRLKVLGKVQKGRKIKKNALEEEEEEMLGFENILSYICRKS